MEPWAIANRENTQTRIKRFLRSKRSASWSGPPVWPFGCAWSRQILLRPITWWSSVFSLSSGNVVAVQGVSLRGWGCSRPGPGPAPTRPPGPFIPVAPITPVWRVVVGIVGVIVVVVARVVIVVVIAAWLPLVGYRPLPGTVKKGNDIGFYLKFYLVIWTI